MTQKVKNMITLFILLICASFFISATETVEAATHQEAESEEYFWSTNWGDGTGSHYMMNLPITDWKSSAPAGSLTGGRRGTDYIVQNGSFVQNPVTWKWSDISKLTMTNSSVWKTRYVKGKPYDVTSYGAGADMGNQLFFYRYEGTFYIDPAYDLTGMNFSIIPVSESPYTYLNVDAYVFVYPLCIKKQISDSDFMNYMVFWSGTQMIWKESQYFHGKPGIPLYYYYASNPPDAFADWDWYSTLNNANASNTVRYGWNQVKNRKDYDGRWGITVVYAGNGIGSSYRYLVGAEFHRMQILYDGNGASNGKNYSQFKDYGKNVNIMENRFQKTGYQFAGWNTKRDGSGTTYQPGQIYNQNKPIKLFAQWRRSQYTITYHGNGATGGNTVRQTCDVDQSCTLSANGFTRTGYTFVGWALKPDGQVTYADKATVSNLSTQNGGNIDLYAKWQANQYTVHFDGNGGTGSMPDLILTYDVPMRLPENIFTKENAYGASTFLGWNRIAEATAVVYGEQAEIVNLAEQNGEKVTLYAIWDDCPWIIADNLYYTLRQAQSGYISEEELMRHATAEDREDGGPIQSGWDESKQTMFRILDYQESDFTMFENDGSVTETYAVVDSAGNCYEKQITVYVVDTEPRQIPFENPTRFIDKKYYECDYEDGGVEDDSIWKTDAAYVSALKGAFYNLDQGTPEKRYCFSHEEILKMKEFIRQNGVRESRLFYDRFLADR